MLFPWQLSRIDGQSCRRCFVRTLNHAPMDGYRQFLRLIPVIGDSDRRQSFGSFRKVGIE